MFSEQFFQQMVLDTIPVRFFWKDCKGSYLGGNRFFLHDVGLHSVEDLIGCTDYDMPWKSIAPDLQQYDASLLSMSSNVDKWVERTFQIASGGVLQIKTFKTAWINRDGLVGGVLGSYENLKPLQKSLKQFEEQHQFLLQKTEAALPQEKEPECLLLHAEKLMRLGTMVAGIAHEVNSPNNLIMMNSSLLDKIWKDVKPVLQKEYATHPSLRLNNIPFADLENEMEVLIHGVMEGSTRIRKVAQGLKDYAKSEPEEIPSTVSLESLVESSLMILEPMLRNLSSQLCLKKSGQEILVKGKKLQLEQVLINLLTNACQALKESRDRITVTYGVHDDGMAFISVDDTGVGIPSEMLVRIQEPFFTTRREEGGTGLGLSISHSIMKAHGGFLHITSVPTQGTHVEMVLPSLSKKDSC